MCHQSVGLIQAAIESVGVATVGVSLCREITEKVRPPRALFVPYPFGFPLGAAHDRVLQTRIISQALSLLDAAGPPPVYAAFDAESERPWSDQARRS